MVHIPWKEMRKVLETARELNLTIYDSAYLWLAKNIGGKLITADGELKRKGGSKVLGELKRPPT